MGLIKAAAGAFGGTMADQWKEFFYCDAIDKDVLVVKGEKRVGGRSSNKKGSDNIISSGSGIAVADGQCMIIVEQGKVVEVCAEPGQFTYDASTEPSIFAGSLGEGIHRTFDTVKKRFTFGGDTGKDQRVYYFNTKELVDNKFGTANPIPFRVVDRNIGLDIDVSVRCNGVYSYKIVDPLLFYTNVCGNVEQQYDREEIEVQLKTEFVSALQPAFAKISELQIRPSAIPGHVLELCDAMNEALTKKWQQTRGLAVVSIAMNPVTLPEEDAQLIKDAQKNAILRDPTMAAATLAGAQADAMKSAASNTAGAMTGFMGMGMAGQAGGNMEGKETRFGIAQSALFTTVTTSFTTGTVNNMHDSLTPLGGLVPMLHMMLNCVFGGKGVGLMNMVMYVILAVFICGLMVGRTPEYLNKKIEGREMKLVALVILIHPLLILGFSALGVATQAGTSGITNPGYHGLSQVLYEFASSAANNGSGFEGLADNSVFWNITTGLAMFFGRYFSIVAQLAIAGSLLAKKKVNESIGSLKTDNVTFMIILVFIVYIFAALTFFPALALGPVAEHLSLWQ